jgi:hypothetical protein
VLSMAAIAESANRVIVEGFSLFRRVHDKIQE